MEIVIFHHKNVLRFISRPTQKEWSCAPHCLPAFVPAKWRPVIEATNDESRPPDSRTPNGTSVISLLITACMGSKFNYSLHVLVIINNSFLITVQKQKEQGPRKCQTGHSHEKPYSFYLWGGFRIEKSHIFESTP